MSKNTEKNQTERVARLMRLHGIYWIEHEKDEITGISKIINYLRNLFKPEDLRDWTPVVNNDAYILEKPDLPVEQVYKIDVSAKYALVCNRPISEAEANQIKLKWDTFINDPNQNVIILGYGVQLIKVDEPGSNV